ncbi:unnamed protein product [Lota lota]
MNTTCRRTEGNTQSPGPHAAADVMGTKSCCLETAVQSIPTLYHEQTEGLRQGGRTPRVRERQRAPGSPGAVRSQFTGSSTQMQCDGRTFTDANEDIVSEKADRAVNQPPNMEQINISPESF